MSGDTIIGGINVYLLLALGFMSVHLMVEALQPGSYVGSGTVGAGAQAPTLVSTMLYFSFTTLTTLGYGNIAPLTERPTRWRPASDGRAVLHRRAGRPTDRQYAP